MKGIDHLQQCAVFWRVVILGGMFLLTGCARSDALWGVVDNLCMTNYQQTRNPAPCQQVYMMQGKGEGISIIQNPRFHLSSPELAEYGVAIVSTNFNGQQGFILLTTKREQGNRASVESLLDKNCEILPH